MRMVTATYPKEKVILTNIYLQLLFWLYWSIHKPHQREEGHKLGAGLMGQDRDIEPINAANY